MTSFTAKSLPPFEAIRYEVVGEQVAVVTLNRPQTRNALDMPMREELAVVAEHLRTADDVRAVVITGAGGSFCAGGDLNSMGEKRSGPQSRKRVAELHSWFSKFANLELPLVAAVDGPAFGGGFNLCLAADFILATPGARFSQVFARVGLVPDLSGLYLLPRMVGLQRAKELIFSARTIDAAEAQELGIVYQIVPSEHLRDSAIELARRLAQASLPAFGLAKTILNRSFESDPRTMAEMEALAQAIAMGTDEHLDAVARFRAKQPLAFEPINRVREAAERPQPRSPQ
ncbi:MAG: enoyl-CoA hydratase/isomerase family protein [Ottowia sp.]|uniref:enoyl-CoA hydratase/isomerase family protein n=1 Tax=Ottowia sp. TaxID=1898956 RepID=UPI003C717816